MAECDGLSVAERFRSLGYTSGGQFIVCCVAQECRSTRPFTFSGDKPMKSLLSLLFALALFGVTVVGCGDTATTDEGGEKATTAEESADGDAEQAAPAAEEQQGEGSEEKS